MRVILLICLFAAAAAAQMPPIEPGVSHELAKWRASQYSNISYKLNLTLEKMSPVLKGTIEIRVTQAAYACAEPNCPPMAIVLDWRKIKGFEERSTISDVSINGVGAARESGSPPYEGGVAAASADGVVLSREPENHPPAKAVPLLRKEGSFFYRESNEHLIFHDGVKMGENVIKLDFTSPILTSGSAITRYIDKEDGSEYIYSLFVPSDASTAFPCFDQPDLKARFSLKIKQRINWNALLKSGGAWRFISNTSGKQHIISDTENKLTGDVDVEFEETKPISTYVFAFAAGPFQEFQYISGDVLKSAEETYFKRPPDPNSFTMNVFVRQSQAVKFRPHAKEVYRLTQEGVKYLETYFDYKFPFPKLDLVLIPEFPFGGMEHAGAIFLREDRVIFPAEPTKGDYLTRANLIFHEAAHQWFGDTVTMKWFDDLWLKEGFAEFMAYKTLEKVMPDANAWKVFYERNKQAAYSTDSTRGTTPIYQKIDNLSAAKSAYGNIVYRKAPSFLRQAEFYLRKDAFTTGDGTFHPGADNFQTAVRAFLKKHAFGNAGWEDLVREFEEASETRLDDWSKRWIRGAGVPFFRSTINGNGGCVWQDDPTNSDKYLIEKIRIASLRGGSRDLDATDIAMGPPAPDKKLSLSIPESARRFLARHYEDRCFDFSHGRDAVFVFPNYGDYGYGIFLLDDKSRDYVLKHIGEEKDPFLRSMMWGALWDSVREAELDPREYVELAIKNLPTETDETISQSILSRVSTAMNYYIDDPGGNASMHERAPVASRPVQGNPGTLPHGRVSARNDLQSRFEAVLLDRLQHAPTPGQRITFYRAYVANATTEKGRTVLKEMLRQASSRKNHPVGETPPPLLRKEGSQNQNQSQNAATPLRTKDRFDIVTRLAILGDPEAPRLLADLERTETSDEAKRYAYAARAAFGTAENKAKFFNDFLTNKNISELWIESAIVPFNSIRHRDLTQQYLEQALKELPNLKRTRKIFFINNWLAAFIGGQRDEKALAIVTKFLADNPTLDNDLRLKVLENLDLIERAVRIRAKFVRN